MTPIKEEQDPADFLSPAVVRVAATIVAASNAVLASFARRSMFNANQSERLRRNLTLTRYDRSMWRGYIGYPTRADVAPAAL